MLRCGCGRLAMQAKTGVSPTAAFSRVCLARHHGFRKRLARLACCRRAPGRLPACGHRVPVCLAGGHVGVLKVQEDGIFGDSSVVRIAELRAVDIHRLLFESKDQPLECQEALCLSARAAQAFAVKAMEPSSFRGNVSANRLARSFCLCAGSEDK